MRSVSRLVDASINTVARELVLAGEACADFHDRTMHGVTTRRVQADEIWSFVEMKEKQARLKSDRPANVGDVWTWTAIEADSKLIISWFVGSRDAEAARAFMHDLESRLANRVQLTTDGYHVYLNAVEEAFGGGIDYAQLVKIYGLSPEGEKRYSPAICLGTDRSTICGRPDPAHVNTSYVERANLTMRMSMRRFTRLTNAFSNKFANYCHMIALYSFWCNFVRIHKTLRVTPAMQAGLTTRLWTFEDAIEMIDELESQRASKSN